MGEVDEPQSGIAFAYRDYLELLGWSGRIAGEDKRGLIDHELPPILSRLQIAPEQWCLNVTRFEFIDAWRFNRLRPSIDTGQVIPLKLNQDKSLYSKTRV